MEHDSCSEIIFLVVVVAIAVVDVAFIYKTNAFCKPTAVITFTFPYSSVPFLFVLAFALHVKNSEIIVNVGQKVFVLFFFFFFFFGRLGLVRSAALLSLLFVFVFVIAIVVLVFFVMS